MAQKTSPKGDKLKHMKRYDNYDHNITDGDRLHRKRQLILKYPKSRENRRNLIEELAKVETSLQKREKIKRHRQHRHDFMFF
jgi:hypothetical protein